MKLLSRAINAIQLRLLCRRASRINRQCVEWGSLNRQREELPNELRYEFVLNLARGYSPLAAEALAKREHNRHNRAAV